VRRKGSTSHNVHIMRRCSGAGAVESNGTAPAFRRVPARLGGRAWKRGGRPINQHRPDALMSVARTGGA